MEGAGNEENLRASPACTTYVLSDVLRSSWGNPHQIGCFGQESGKLVLRPAKAGGTACLG